MPDFSLFKLIESLTPSPLPLTVRLSYFEVLVRAWLEFLRENGIKATIWLKLPQNSNFLAAITQYEQAGLAEQLYFCQIGDGPTDYLSTIFLEASTQLWREYFFLVLSPQFSGLLVAQQENQEPAPSSIKLAHSLTPSVIESALRGIQRAIASKHGTLDSAALSGVLPSFPLPTLLEAKLLDCLLRKQIEASQSEELASIEQTEGQTPEFSSPEFVKNLVQELIINLTNLKMSLILLNSLQNNQGQPERHLQLAQRECDRQSSLVAGLQELIEIYQSAASFQPSAQLEDLIPVIVSTYQPLAKERGIILGYTVPAELPLVSCPSNWLQRLLQHLLDNSLKFTPAQGQVQVRALQKQELVEVTVTDTGVGIEPKDLPKIFLSFYRGASLSNKEAISAGLGLTAVQQILQLCGGSIEITSNPGKGTVVTVLLPTHIRQVEKQKGKQDFER